MKTNHKLFPSFAGIFTLVATAFSAQGALVAYYNMDETSGNIADSSGNNLTGVVQSIGSTFAYNQPSVTAGTYGAITVDATTATFFGGSFQGGTTIGNRRNFNIGAPAIIGDLVTAGSGASDGTGTMTVMGWINLDEITGSQRIFGTGDVGGDGGWAFGTFNNQLRFTTFGGADNNIAASLVAGTWYHIAVTYNDNALGFYLNGNLLGTDSNAGNFIEENPTGANYRVGASRDGLDQFYGLYDEVKIFNTVLTVDEIRAAAIPEPSAALLGGLGMLLLLRRRR